MFRLLVWQGVVGTLSICEWHVYTTDKSITSNAFPLWAIFPLIAFTNLWILGNNCQYRKHNINWHSWWFYVLWHLVYGVLLIIFLIFHLISGKIERFGSCLLTSQKTEKTSRQISIRLTSDSIPFVFHLWYFTFRTEAA